MTHKEKVLALLADRQPHSHREGYRLGVMLHSRAADLRRDGYDIRCWRDRDHYMYQLVGGLSEPDTGGVDETAKGLGRSATLSGSESLFELPRGAYQDVA